MLEREIAIGKHQGRVLRKNKWFENIRPSQESEK